MGLQILSETIFYLCLRTGMNIICVVYEYVSQKFHLPILGTCSCSISTVMTHEQIEMCTVHVQIAAYAVNLTDY